MQLLTGNQFRYEWFCPRTGKVIAAGKISKNKSHEFDPPGMQVDGNDWVLILENI
jgi:TPP-dependent pyruvate/acetoin dehydrogenase alpha subunit